MRSALGEIVLFYKEQAHLPGCQEKIKTGMYECMNAWHHVSNLYQRSFRPKFWRQNNIRTPTLVVYQNRTCLSLRLCLYDKKISHSWMLAYLLHWCSEHLAESTNYAIVVQMQMGQSQRSTEHSSDTLLNSIIHFRTLSILRIVLPF